MTSLFYGNILSILLSVSSVSVLSPMEECVRYHDTLIFFQKSLTVALETCLPFSFPFFLEECKSCKL